MQRLMSYREIYDCSNPDLSRIEQIVEILKKQTWNYPNNDIYGGMAILKIIPYGEEYYLIGGVSKDGAYQSWLAWSYQFRGALYQIANENGTWTTKTIHQ